MAAVPRIAWLMRDNTRDVGLRPYGEAGPEWVEASVLGTTRSTSGNPAKQAIDVLIEAVRERDFWLLAGSFFGCGASTNGLSNLMSFNAKI